ncbi:MAG: alpha/beta hydrolase [Asticcacaulis sp.]|nr:alpha/beta hydrolase [Asticcacaulis sp.]
MSRIAALSANAPLMSIPESRVPDNGSGEWFRGAGGLRLRLGFWEPKRPARGTVFISPGRAEPIEKYYETIRDLLGRDMCVVAHDWRGQGLSARLLPDRLKCHARSTEEFLDDYQRLLDAFEDRAPKPWVMLGHSMGAALNLATLVKGEPRISGAFFINPMLRMKTGKHALWSVNFQTNWQVNHGRGTDYVPEIFDDPFEHTFENDALTHDRSRYETWREQLFACPHLAVGSPTWGWLSFALKIGETLLKDKGKVLKKLKTPITICCAGDDRVIQKQMSKQFAKKLFKGQYVEIPGAEHELLIEADEYRNATFTQMDELLDFVAPRGIAGEVRSERRALPDDAIAADAMPEDEPFADEEGLPEDEAATAPTDDQKSA